ncbi:glycoside hydrolase family 2 TIM barrel-domain containing protein [Haliea sp. E17]|uniref:glycoside hydrolase family 2 TIM barrel-domain containing protein n=1 Tax=Haliea sp. E17 TaxID=3401576 RepID=UPI003AAF5F72
MKITGHCLLTALLALASGPLLAAQPTPGEDAAAAQKARVASMLTGEEGEKHDVSELFGGLVQDLPSPDPLMTNVDGRAHQTLNGAWNVVVDEHSMGAKGLFGTAYYTPPEPQTGMELVEFSFDPRRQLEVPGDWNTQDERLYRYRDIVWYQRDFDLQKAAGKRYYLHFDGVNYKAHVYLNGKPLATHRGGYTAFNVDVTDAAKDGSNYLVVRVDAYLDDSTIPTKRTSDFFKYGGIIRDVDLVTVPATYARQYQFYLADLASGRVDGWVQLDGPQAANREIKVDIDEAGVHTSARTDANGRATFSFTAKLDLWSPEHPRLYDVAVSDGDEQVVDRIGFRTIAIEGKQILLNGKPVYLRGVALHDESILKPGMANDRADAEASLGLARELNANYVRLAHYPHNEHTLRVADELGLMVWSEIPIVSLIDWANPDTLQQALGMVRDNIDRDRNRASIVFWSVSNESMPQSPERLAFLTQLAEQARSLDESARPIASALVGDPAEFKEILKRLVAELLFDPQVTDPKVKQQLAGMAKKMIGDDDAVQKVLHGELEVMLRDPLGEVVDLIGYNEYFGWYYSAGLSRVLPVDEATTRRTMLNIMKDVRFRNAFGKPIVISEFGAGAKKGFVSEHGPGAIWSEEYQAKVYEKQLDMLGRSDFVQGISPWVLKDFRSAMRPLNGIQELYNRKGLVSETGERKQAFFVLRDFYAQKSGK